MPTHRFCAFDIETRSRSSTFVSGALWSDEEQLFTPDRDRLVEALRRHAKKGYVLVAHNAEYDVTNLLWRAGEEVTLHYFESTFTVAYWRYGKGKRVASIWDSMRLAAGLSLGELGKAIGLPKLEPPRKLLDPDDWRQDWICSAHQVTGCLECYNLRDAQIAHAWVVQLRDWLDANYVQVRRTLPSIAAELWKVWDPEQHQTLRSKELQAFCRRGYHGARCEVFRYGTNRPIHVADKQSFYGSILLDCPMPDLSSLRHARAAAPDGPWLEAEGMVDAEVYVPDCHVPVLPAVVNEQLFYPVGWLRGTWPIRELRAAIERGAEVQRVYQVAWTPKTVLPFQMFAGGLLGLRAEALAKGSPLALFYKMLLNALPGRLGLRDDPELRVYRTWRAGESRGDRAGWALEGDVPMLYLSRAHKLKRQSWSANVLWAATITAEGRLRLLPHLEEAGQALTYCDTDSVHSISPIRLEGDGPGLLGDRGEYAEGVYLAPKLYRLETWSGGELIRAKGIPASAAKRYFDDGLASFQTALGVVEGAARGLSPGQWIEVTRSYHPTAARRQLLNVAALKERDQDSTTVPISFSPDGEGGSIPHNWTLE